MFLTGSVERDRAAPVSPVEGHVDVGVTSDLLEEKRTDGAPVTEGCVNRRSRPGPAQSRRVVIDAIRQSLLTPLTCSAHIQYTTVYMLTEQALHALQQNQTYHNVYCKMS